MSKLTTTGTDTVLAHIDAMLYISRESGRFVLKLIRPDYNIDDLLVIGEDDVVTWENIKRRQPSEAVNSLSVAYYDRVKAARPGTFANPVYADYLRQLPPPPAVVRTPARARVSL
mgnify:CR=1 FL=1